MPVAIKGSPTTTWGFVTTIFTRVSLSSKDTSSPTMLVVMAMRSTPACKEVPVVFPTPIVTIDFSNRNEAVEQHRHRWPVSAEQRERPKTEHLNAVNPRCHDVDDVVHHHNRLAVATGDRRTREPPHAHAHGASDKIRSGRLQTRGDIDGNC